MASTPKEVEKEIEETTTTTLSLTEELRRIWRERYQRHLAAQQVEVEEPVADIADDDELPKEKEEPESDVEDDKELEKAMAMSMQSHVIHAPQQMDPFDLDHLLALYQDQVVPPTTASSAASTAFTAPSTTSIEEAQIQEMLTRELLEQEKMEQQARADALLAQQMQQGTPHHATPTTTLLHEMRKQQEEWATQKHLEEQGIIPKQQDDYKDDHKSNTPSFGPQ